VSQIDPVELTERYVALWMEPDAAARRAAVERLWAPDGVHVLQPPAEHRQAALDLGFTDAALEARGHDAIAFRAAAAHREFVTPGTYRFRSRGDADRLRQVVKFTWEMVTADDAVAGVGLEILLLDADGRISADHQFIVG
jgi:hypothetical protein